MKYVALVQQGMVLDQRAVAVGEDETTLREQAEAEAAKLNEGATMTEAWVAVVVPVSE